MVASEKGTVVEKLHCSAHGGTFTRQSARGRKPSTCKDTNPCTKSPNRHATTDTVVRGPSRVERTASAIKNRRSTETTTATKKLDGMSIGELRAYALAIGMSTGTKATNKPEMLRAIRAWQARTGRGVAVAALQDAAEPIKESTPKSRRTRRGSAAVAFTDGTQTTPEPSKTVAVPPTKPNKCIAPAKEAKRRLVALGWKVECVAITEDGTDTATLDGARGDEIIAMRWVDGACVSQQYSMWDQDVPKTNNKPTPKRALPIDVDTASDADVVRALSGMHIEWWNVLGARAENAVVPGTGMQVQHRYSGLGDETPADRVVTFVDRNAGGYRSFRLGALLKIG